MGLWRWASGAFEYEVVLMSDVVGLGLRLMGIIEMRICDE